MRKKTPGYNKKRMKKHTSNNKVRINDNPELIGLVKMNRDGDAFVSIEGKEESVFIRKRNLKRALNGDLIKLKLINSSRNQYKKTKVTSSGSQQYEEGILISIIKRSHKPFVGILHIINGKALVIIQNRFMPYDVSLELFSKDKPINSKSYLIADKKQKGSYLVSSLNENVDGESGGDTKKHQTKEVRVKSGMKVAVVIDDWKRGNNIPTGHIVDVLGNPNDNDTEMHSILVEYSLPYRFSSEVEVAANKISEKVTKEEYANRIDFRDRLSFTIDPKDAKDFDDALSIKQLSDDKFEVGIHIADVTHYVLPDSIIDKEARERGTSVYLVDRTVPMLPTKLCNEICSLRPQEDKLAFSAIFEISSKGKIYNQKFVKTLIRSDYRLTYEQAQSIIEKKEPTVPLNNIANETKSITEAILNLWKIAEALKKERFEKGAIAFNRPEMKVEVDEKGVPVGVYRKFSKEANALVEEFMLLANRKVAEYIASNGHMNNKAVTNPKTFIYRIHEEPNQEKLNSLKDFVHNFGYRFAYDKGKKGSKNIAKAINELLDSAEGCAEFNAIEMLTLRCMAKATYSTDNVGHYGLAFDFYTHFTSPIRRYPDIMVHRLLDMYLSGKESQNKNYYAEQCKYAFERENLAVEAERASIKYKVAEFMQDKVGMEFDGHISGLTDWGIYVEVEPTCIEGMITLRSIKSDFYDFDPQQYIMVGRRSSNIYRLGDNVRVRVKEVNLEQKLIDYELISN